MPLQSPSDSSSAKASASFLTDRAAAGEIALPPGKLPRIFLRSARYLTSHPLLLSPASPVTGEHSVSPTIRARFSWQTLLTCCDLASPLRGKVSRCSVRQSSDRASIKRPAEPRL